jgi:hypothetical protein
MQSILNESDSDDWSQIAPLLDETLNCLGTKEHDAVVLRFLDGKELKHVGAAMGTTEDGARMRVNRGLEKLRAFFTKRGVSLSTAAIAGAVSANSVQAAPAGLAAAITAAALSGTAITTTAVIAATKVIAMTTVQKAIITVAFAAVAGTGISEARKLRVQIQTLQQQQTPLAEQVQQLQHERDDAKSQLESLLVQNEQLKTNQHSAELLKLRGEVASLRVQARALAQLKSPDTQNHGDPLESAAKDLVGRMNLLKQRLEQMPDKNIPELQCLDNEAWARIAQTAKLDTEAGVREALSDLRNLAKEKFAPQMGKALQAYAQANEGQLPTDASQLKPYFECNRPAAPSYGEWCGCGRMAG